MLYINNESTDPFFNLALEEYLLTKRADLGDVFLLWQDEPTVVVGRNQNSAAEVNQSFLKENNIHLVRRLSGGGAVYHDLGNINFTFIIDNVDREGINFPRFTAPIIKTLASLGIKAENTGRNDITIKGKKFSGNAQYHFQNRILHHGTLLFNSDFDDMTKALTVDPEKLSLKGIQSVRSRVTNICDYLPEAISTERFKSILRDGFLNDNPGSLRRELTVTELAEVKALRRDKYITWEWIHGKSPGFNFNNEKRFDWGKLETQISIKNGKINHVKFYGDFFDVRDINELTYYLKGIEYDYQTVEKKLHAIDLEEFIAGLTPSQLLSLLFT